MSKRAVITHAEAPEGAPVLWRSLDERESPARRERAAAVEPEMNGAGELVAIALERRSGDRDSGRTVGRRTFLTFSASAAGAATLSGCLRRPVEHILPYARQPEYVVPGVPLHYATVLPRRGDAIGVVVESHEGRPTKIEGNPEHPVAHPGRREPDERIAHAGTDLQTQAAILDLYDIDRSAHVLRGRGETRTESSWGEFDEWLADRLASHEASAGDGLRVLMAPTSSPTLLAARRAFLARFPRARVHFWSTVSDWNRHEGARLAFGRPLHTLVDYARARVILSLDDDFLLTESENPRAQHLFADGRRLRSAADAAGMNRLYQVESVLSVTGANADHRLRLPSRDVGLYLRALARALGEVGVDVSALRDALGEPGAGFPAPWLAPVANDLARNRGRSAIVVGSRQPPWVHALAHALNVALGNVGPTITYHEVLDVEQRDPVRDLRALTEDMANGRVRTLLVLGVNPVFEAPADVDFRGALHRVEESIHLASHDDETSEHCTWHLPMAHELESWGDQRSWEGAYAIQQPLIAPLRGGRNAIELLGFASGERSWRAYHAVRRTVAAFVPADAFEPTWRTALQRGVVPGTPSTLATVALDAASVAGAVREVGARAATALGEGNWEVVFVADNKLLDGRSANNPWLLELPDPITRLSWDNAALMSVASARALGVRNGDLVRIEADGVEPRSLPVLLVPGMADDTIALPLGWGRRRVGRYGNGAGFDVHPLRTSQSYAFGDGYRVARAGGRHPLALTQEHHAMEGRPIAIDATVEQYRQTPDFAQWRIPEPSAGPLWTEVDYTTPHPPAQGGRSWSLLAEQRPPAPDAPPRHAWGMVIDLTTCTGCNACAVACIAENNIPMVGKDQVARGREMHWMRIDRYFGERQLPPSASPDDAYRALDEDHLEVAFQPVACQHCEEAPCENVCPVAATAHSPEGINEMAYNRCIGTRYCANNCPYKVRRFNYLAYQGHVTELQRMQFNPNVSVRMRGVIEKCTYCVQRVQAARIHARNEGRRIREGEVVPACAQACPSQAITFGDLNDAESAVARAARIDRRYKLLADVGTQPRTTFLGKIRNPNPEMV